MCKCLVVLESIACESSALIFNLKPIKTNNMDNIKLVNDAVSITAVTLQDYMNGELNMDTFTKALYQNFPKEVAEHVEAVVSKIVQYQEYKEQGLL